MGSNSSPCDPERLAALAKARAVLAARRAEAKKGKPYSKTPRPKKLPCPKCGLKVAPGAGLATHIRGGACFERQEARSRRLSEKEKRATKQRVRFKRRLNVLAQKGWVNVTGKPGIQYLPGLKVKRVVEGGTGRKALLLPYYEVVAVDVLDALKEELSPLRDGYDFLRSVGVEDVWRLLLGRCRRDLRWLNALRTVLDEGDAAALATFVDETLWGQ